MSIQLTRETYLRPLGLQARRGDDDMAEEVGGCLPLAGGWLDFSALEVIRRDGRQVTRKILGLGDFFDRDWGARTIEASDQFEALTEPRIRRAGLTLERPRIMGIVNVTPDSFSDGGFLGNAQTAIDHARRMEEQGADIIDIGGESTRPGSYPVSLEEELRRVMPVIEALAGRTEARISIDTRKAEVMRLAAEAGADMLNDVSALSYDPEAMSVAAETGLPIILMHALGDPKTMQKDPRYDDVLLDVYDFLEARMAACQDAGIKRDRLIVDPGIGFGKTIQHNLTLLAGLAIFHSLGVPVLLGASRKRFLGTLTGVETASERVIGSVAAALAGVAQGAQIVRVHDVEETRQALDVWEAATRGSA